MSSRAPRPRATDATKGLAMVSSVTCASTGDETVGEVRMGCLVWFAAAAARGSRAAGGAALAGDAAARGRGGGAVEAAMDLHSESATVRDSQGHLNVDASRETKTIRNGARRGPAQASGAIGKVALLRASRGDDAGPRDRSPRPSHAVAPSVR